MEPPLQPLCQSLPHSGIDQVAVLDLIECTGGYLAMCWARVLAFAWVQILMLLLISSDLGQPSSSIGLCPFLSNGDNDSICLLQSYCRYHMELHVQSSH